MIELLSIVFYTITACLLVTLAILATSLLLEVTLKESAISFETISLISLLGVITVLIMWVLSGLALGVYGAFTY